MVYAGRIVPNCLSARSALPIPCAISAITPLLPGCIWNTWSPITTSSEAVFGWSDGTFDYPPCAACDSPPAELQAVCAAAGSAVNSCYSHLLLARPTCATLARGALLIHCLATHAGTIALLGNWACMCYILFFVPMAWVLAQGVRPSGKCANNSCC